MFPVSKRFLSAIRTGAKRKTVVDVYYGGMYIRTLPVSEGKVNLDRSSLVMGSGSLTIGDPDLIPRFANSSLAPYAIEITIRTGPVGATWEELVPLGIFRLQNTNWTEAAGRIPTIEFFDRSQALQEANFLAPIDRSGYTIKSTIATFIKDVFPNCVVTFCADTTELLLPGGTIFQESRVDAIQTCLGILGSEGHFDENGDFFVVDIPHLEQDTPLTDAVYVIEPGEQGTLADATRGVSRDGVLNGVTVFGATSEAGVQAVGQAVDDDPQSPTYFGTPTLNPAGLITSTKGNSPFGMATTQITNDTLKTNDQCTAFAKAFLKNHLGLAKSLSLTCCSNPALRPGDTILVKFLDGTSELHIIDTMSIPLAGGDMDITTRALTYQFGIGPPDTDGGEQGSEFDISWQDVISNHYSWQDVKDTRTNWSDVLING